MKLQNLNCTFLCTLILTLSFSTQGVTQEKSQSMKTWFAQKNCTSLQVMQYQSISNQKILSQINIEDADVISQLIQRIESIEVDGDMMIKFGPDAKKMDLVFHCEDNYQQIISVINKRFKTPSTGFNTSNNQIESELYEDFDALLFPDLNKKLLKIKHFNYQLKNFSIQYQGWAYINTDSTAKARFDKFKIIDHQKQEQFLKSTSGQLPPQALPFNINHDQYYFLPFESINKVRLYPIYFQITQ
jgi:hypothetical protein